MPQKVLRLLLLSGMPVPAFSTPTVVHASCASPILPGEWHTQPGNPVQYVLDVNLPPQGGSGFWYLRKRGAGKE